MARIRIAGGSFIGDPILPHPRRIDKPERSVAGNALLKESAVLLSSSALPILSRTKSFLSSSRGRRRRQDPLAETERSQRLVGKFSTAFHWGGHEPIAHAAYGEQVARPGRILFNVTTQPHDKVVNSAGVGVLVKASHLFEHGFSRHGPALVLDEVAQHVHFHQSQGKHLVG